MYIMKWNNISSSLIKILTYYNGILPGKQKTTEADSPVGVTPPTDVDEAMFRVAEVIGYVDDQVVPPHGPVGPLICR